MSQLDPHEELSNHLTSVLQLLDARETKQLNVLINDLHPAQLVNILNAVDPEHQSQLLRQISGLDHLSEVIARANEHLRKMALDLIDDSRIAAVIRRQEIDDAADIISSLPRRRQVKVLRRLQAQQVKELTSLLAYDQDTAGRIMTTRFLSFGPELQVSDAIGSLCSNLNQGKIEKETNLTYIYLLDTHGRPSGVFSLRELLSAGPEEILKDLATSPVLSVKPDDDQEKVARLIADYDLSAIPVCSEEDQKLLGIITVDDVLDIIEEEHTEDLLKLAGTEDKDTVGASIIVAVRSRLPWLIASWLGGVFGASLLGTFSSVIEKLVALAFFMPVVFGMGGNVGSQSSTITVRGLATGELLQERSRNRLRKEACIGALLGIIFGVLLSLVAFLFFRDFHLSMIVGISILTTMTCASALGSMVPIVFKRLGLDPAVASGPLVTTTTDILSITIYFTIASILLK